MSHRIYNMSFAGVFQALIDKAERKGKTRQDVLDLTSWLTGYDLESIEQQLQSDLTYGDFFRQAPNYTTYRTNITGKICGVQIETIEDPHAGNPPFGPLGWLVGQGQISSGYYREIPGMRDYAAFTKGWPPPSSVSQCPLLIAAFLMAVSPGSCTCSIPSCWPIFSGIQRSGFSLISSFLAWPF